MYTLDLKQQHVLLTELVDPKKMIVLQQKYKIERSSANSGYKKYYDHDQG